MVPQKWTHRHTNRQTNRQTDILTYRKHRPKGPMLWKYHTDQYWLASCLNTLFQTLGHSVSNEPIWEDYLYIFLLDSSLWPLEMSSRPRAGHLQAQIIFISIYCCVLPAELDDYLVQAGPGGRAGGNGPGGLQVTDRPLMTLHEGTVDNNWFSLAVT